jgi:hypothetical protein
MKNDADFGKIIFILNVGSIDFDQKSSVKLQIKSLSLHLGQDRINRVEVRVQIGIYLKLAQMLF